MRLESALFSSREGISAHGQAIAVIGDNISNANTVGFRASRVQFGDLVAGGRSTSETSSIPSTGSGVAIQGVRPVQETGVIEATGRSLDVAIEGRGFIIVGDPQNPAYTRAGALSVSKEGILVDSNGEQVLGFASAGGDTLETLDVNKISLSGKATTAATLSGNLASNNPITEVPASPGTFKEIGQKASFVASDLRVFDSLGQSHAVLMAFYKTGGGQWKAQAYVDASETGGEKGIPVKVGGEVSLNFGPDGRLVAGSAAQVSGTINYGNGSAQGSFTIDLSGFSQFAGSSQTSSLTQDGQAAGNILDYEIRKDGAFYARLDTGQSLQVGTLRLADFVNVDGLQRAGNGLFVATEGAGERRLGQPGQSGLGTLAGASLERSTVDIANQFVELVLFQRGYQASSQTLSAASTLLHDTISLIR
ncbi:MAG: flagellar hook protein FlgE [Oligoflexia bacterium]|nr:flagellar hook protein FlgE [Oligoflexia bacterium]